MNYNPLDDEEERKRREAEIAAMGENEPVGRGPIDPSFLDTAKQYLGNRFDNAMNRVSNAGQTLMNPQQATEQRMANEQQQEAADTEVKTQTVKTFGDGSQEQVVKTQVPAGQAQQPQQQPPQAQFGGMMGPVSPNSPEAQQQAQAFAQQMARSQQQNRGLTTPIPGMPDNLPAEGRIPAQAAQQAPVMAQLPQPGPAVRVAGQTQMPPQAAAPGASLAQAGAQAQTQPTPVVQAGTPFTPTAEREVEQPKLWVQSANDAGTDFYKLLDVANKHPESRDMISEKIKQSFKQQTMKDDAEAIMKAAQAGDLKAMNKIQQAIRPESGKGKEEVTIMDYLAAVAYKRLGLDALAAERQNKIIGKDTKFGQITLGGANWEIETDPSGKIIRAKDNEGNIATESTLNQLRAGGQKFGSQAFGFTGEAATIPQGQPDAGQEYRQRTNSISGAIENVITTGPNANKIYSGPPGAAKSVGTSYSKALNDAFIKFQTAPTTEMAKTMLDIAGQVDNGDGKTIAMVNEKIRQLQPAIFNQISSGQAGTPPAPTGTGDNVKALDSLNRDLESNAREVARLPANDPRRKILAEERTRTEARIAELGGRVAPSVGGAATGTAGTSLGAQKAAIGTQAAVNEARQKPPAEAAGKNEATDINNQRTADENYAMIKPINDLIKQATGSGLGARVDTLASFFGVGTKGAQATQQLNVMSYPFKYMIPRFEGPQSDKDTALYVEAAGDFANPKKTQAERLAALQGMVFMLKKYDKAGKNDWTYGESQGKAEPGTTSSGNKYKKVQ